MATPALTALGAWPLFGEVLLGGQWFGIGLVVCGGILVESRRLPIGRRPGNEAAAVVAPGEDGRSHRIGLLAAVAATLAWSSANLVLHEGLHHTGPVTGGALRLAAGTLGFALWFLLRGQLRGQLRKLGTAESWRHFALPTLLGTVVGMSLFTAAFKWAPQGVAASLTATVPLFALPLSIWLLGERPNWRGWSGSLVVVLGVFLVGKLL
jgi:drug/metabolite transporter (DMT)-like permease